MSECYIPFEIEDFIRNSLDSVRLSKEDENGLKCKQMQSFGYVEDWSGISAEDLGASIQQIKREEDLYIRSMKDMFPLLLITPDRIEMNDVLDKWSNEADIFEISFIDELQKNCDNCGACGKRDDKLIRKDLRVLVRAWFSYIEKICYATFTEEGNEISGWYNEEVLKAREAAGHISGFSWDYVKSKNARTQLRLANTGVQPQNINFGESYVGILLKFKIPQSYLKKGGFDHALNDKNQAFK